MAEEPAIVYSVKELISRLDGKLDAIMSVLTNKADRADVTALERRVDSTEGEIKGIKEREKRRLEEKNKATLGKRWMVALVTSITLGLLSAAVALFSALHK